ncbi:uncharacterized protein LY89DRAFT_142375 [Mollisia scopiformis]|uniref:Uncharacterized protein n=1 Tax=Mollisia scopiformis TaxID=149040 RepID=A0A194X3D2_MOLSC|nr:uncharacterized protein LY89DRAFT_142375 [Mollisia scopiformis]KUJ14534.1 hypothetical protein LY89DRAFT_142375 [Mollisia scopiformis]
MQESWGGVISHDWNCYNNDGETPEERAVRSWASHQGSAVGLSGYLINCYDDDRPAEHQYEYRRLMITVPETLFPWCSTGGITGAAVANLHASTGMAWYRRKKIAQTRKRVGWMSTYQPCGNVLAINGCLWMAEHGRPSRGMHARRREYKSSSLHLALEFLWSQNI